MGNFAPIALFVYNRPWHTQQTLNALAANEGAGESDLYIFSDGPKKNADPETLEKIREVREIIRSEKRFKKIILAEQEENSGLANSIINGVTKLVNEHGRIIVLEDDLVTSPVFLRFMNESLEEYVDDDRVVCITGYIYPVKEKLPGLFFLRGADCWGWATWKRGWEVFEADGKKLLDELEAKNLSHDFDFDGTYPYTQMLREQVEGKNSSWAIRWYASAFLNHQLTLYPGKSLVQNIGVDGSGTHSGTSGKWDVQLATKCPEQGVNGVGEDVAARAAVAQFFREMQSVPLGKRILNKFARLFS